MKLNNDKILYMDLLFLIIAGFISTPSIGQYAVRWTDEIGVKNVENVLIKTASNGWNNGGATSSNILASGQNGYIEFTVGTQKSFSVGFVSGEFYQIASNNFIAAINISSSGILSVSEGTSTTTFGKVTSGDKLGIQRNATSLGY